MNAVVSVALPVFAVIAAGFLAARLGALSAADSQTLNKFVFKLAMPVALFGLAARAAPPGSAEDAGIAIAYGAAAAVTILGAYFLSRPLFSLSPQEAGAHAFSSTLGNAVFLGLPIAMNVPGWDRPFIVLMAIEGTAVIALGAALIAPRGENKNALSFLAGPMKNPLVIGMAAGFIYSALGLPLTGPFETFFDYLGRAAGPTALISLGVFLATHQFPKMGAVAGRIGAIILAKMALLPVIALGAAYALGVADTAYLGALALFCLVPTGVVSFVMASQFKVYETEAAAAVLAATLLSVLTISGVLWVYA